MDCCILRKVPYRLPNSSRLVWAVIVAESEGIALCFLPKPNGNQSHALVLATENPAERVFEAVNTCQFAIDHNDLEQVGDKLRALAENLSKQNFRHRFFGDDDSWWKE